MKPKKNKKKNLSFDIYTNTSKIKWGALGISLIIIVASIIYTDVLVEKLQQREKRQIELYAKALEYAMNVSEGESLLFLTEEIITRNSSVPIIWADSYGKPLDSKNISFRSNATESEKEAILKERIKLMKEQHKPIKIVITDDNGVEYDYSYVYYQNSFLLTQLKYYPYVQLSFIAFFGFLAYLAFHYSKLSEQNRVWIGLAKETAHQLGTPLSSLMAWIEYLKIDPDFNNPEVITELEKDTHRLEMITNRFSSIGSVPTLKKEDLVSGIRANVSYLQRRISSKVKIGVQAQPEFIEANINKALFDWVIENLCKNAVDAMAGMGEIKINIFKEDDSKIVIDVTDNGKGIPKTKAGQIFKPGFSTKQRGWGLGLTLVKRIVEQYHKGKIFLKSSEVGKGTTFRIILKGE
ncbi:sensor histidine kinase [Aureibacter tunicatorum]|uniref:histidine kinase n=1 Tax=Aureibacter tunicatorum TaxID=866807 RepID=A0AAE3XPA4_9BACT|nr:HAMP domain-containing sensor histidine kinase [Aureibacter tunicatorum]MDR6240112.1 two-component sensor histidine kinase [Aureibacter tunicatorum]BDD06007.1 two-component sensor histidine kinase [Aureibacter tunicatorum]